MTRGMPDWLRFPLVLLIVAVISAASLAGLYAVTQPKKLAMEKEMMRAALNVVMPDATSFDDERDGDFIYRVAKRDGRTIGYVAEGQATGYSSILKVFVGVDKKFVIHGIKVLAQKETPGLGDKVEEILSKKTWGTIIAGTSPDEEGLRPWFQTQFDGKSAPVKVAKDGGEIEAITGATISSSAVCDAVNSAVLKLKEAVR